MEEILLASMLLPEPGGPITQHIMPAGCCNLQRPLRTGLPFDIGKIRQPGRSIIGLKLEWRDGSDLLLIAQMGD